MNVFQPDKLLHSKWTAISPQDKERHFIVIKITDKKNRHCQLEAVLTKQRHIIDWQSLRDESQWLMGWH
ncbi:MAG: TIGR02450 family Trp-rich protein [Methylophaga sp.]|nr:TIGR02450 family Trp-rich protein [Methylophaga sp.]